MAVEQVETLVVGAGQAGVAMSEHLTRERRAASRARARPHRRALAHRTLGFAGRQRPGLARPLSRAGRSTAIPTPSPPRREVADYFVAYAEKIDAPIRCGVEVACGHRHDGRPGFRVETSAGVIEARNVVAATGPFQRPVFPPIVPESAGITQIHSAAYRNPGQLPGGRGAGGRRRLLGRADRRRAARARAGASSSRSARTTARRAAIAGATTSGGSAFSTSGTSRRRRRTKHVTIAVSGAHGGQTIDFRRLAARGMTLVGRTASFADGVMTLRARSRREPRARRRQLPVGARRGRRLCRAQRPRPAGGARGARSRCPIPPA